VNKGPFYRDLVLAGGGYAHLLFLKRWCMQPVAGVRSAETVASVMAYHTTPSQAAEIANQARVRALMLTHIVPPAADRSALLREIRAGYAGPVMVGEDLMRFDLVNRIVRNGNTAVAI